MGQSTISMAIFNSYVSLPEGIYIYIYLIYICDFCVPTSHRTTVAITKKIRLPASSSAPSQRSACEARGLPSLRVVGASSLAKNASKAKQMQAMCIYDGI